MAKSTEQLCRVLDALYKENSRDKLEAFFMEEILDHVPGCCDVSSEYIFLMNEAGAYYRSISCYEQAASYFQGLLSTMERFGLNGSAAYATVLNNLAGVYRMTGQLEQAQERRQQEEQRQAQVKKTARCCGQDMTKLGVSTFQLGEHTFLGGDLDHLLSGSMKMAVFRCEVCGRLKFFDPEWVQ